MFKKINGIVHTRFYYRREKERVPRVRRINLGYETAPVPRIQGRSNCNSKSNLTFAIKCQAMKAYERTFRRFDESVYKNACENEIRDHYGS